MARFDYIIGAVVRQLAAAYPVVCSVPTRQFFVGSTNSCFESWCMRNLFICLDFCQLLCQTNNDNIPQALTHDTLKQNN